MCAEFAVRDLARILLSHVGLSADNSMAEFDALEEKTLLRRI